MNLTRTAIMLTAHRRPQYLRQTLAAWAQVDGIQDVAAFRVCLDPSDRLEKMLTVIAEARSEYGLDIEARVNTRHLGVSVNPVEGGTGVLSEYPDVDYLVMAEEDLVVADDTLRYLSWADETFRDTPGVLINCAHSPDNPDPDADPAAVVLLPRFRCWIWGTWRDRWHHTLVPTWDRNYSTGTPEQPNSGFDWNIDLRVIPQGGYVCALPLASRSQNKGKFEGVHADASGYDSTQNPSFREKFGEVDYRLADYRVAST